MAQDSSLSATRPNRAIVSVIYHQITNSKTQWLRPLLLYCLLWLCGLTGFSWLVLLLVLLEDLSKVHSLKPGTRVIWSFNCDGGSAGPLFLST